MPWLAPFLLLYSLAALAASIDAAPNFKDRIMNRIDCHPEPGASQQRCVQRGCTWDNAHTTPAGIPFCFYEHTTGYKRVALSLQPLSASHNPFYDNMAIKLSSSSIGSVLNVKFYADGRNDPLVDLPRKGLTSSEQLVYTSDSSAPDSTFAFTVQRKSDGTKLWDTSIGGLLFGDQFIQIATYLPTRNIYGFGDHIHKRIRHNMGRYTTWPMFARDIGPDSFSNLSTTNLYGVHPFYMAMEASGKAHGVLILNSHAQEVTLGPSPHLVYRTIGGNIDLYFFPGPSPEEVIRQYHNFIGKTFLPAYWGFGFQLSRWGYQSFEEMVQAVDRTRQAGVPLDMVVADIDYIDRYKIFTLGWKDLPHYVTQLHDDGLRLTIIVDPGVQVNYATFERARRAGAQFVQWPTVEDVPPVNVLYPLTNNTLFMLGNVWPDNNTAMPDFMDPSKRTVNWWAREFHLFHSTLAFDNIWIDMNEPSNFDTDPITGAKAVDQKYRLKCPVDQPKAKYDNPKYLTWAVYGFGQGNYLFTKTECMMGMVAQHKRRLYDTHSLYGTWMAKQTQVAQNTVLRNRGAMISRSTYPSAGRYTGHWLGDNTAHWEDLQTSVIGAMEFNMFGLPFVGSDICGFFGNTTEELCLRWQQMGAFHPFSRNHNAAGNSPQDPGQWKTVAAAARQALLFKYHYLPYMYTLFYESSMNGGTVLRPLFFEFPNDTATYDIGYQFMWGSGMMIIPVLFPGKTSVDAYIPPSATWYSLREDDYGTVLPKQPAMKTFSAKTTELIPVLARGGVILTRQPPANVLRNSRRKPFELVIPLDYGRGNVEQYAAGSFFWDNGEKVMEVWDIYWYYYTMNFTLTNDSAMLNIEQEVRANDDLMLELPSVDMIDILGYPVHTTDTVDVLLNTRWSAERIKVPTKYNATTKVLHMEKIGLIDWRNHLSIKFSWRLSKSPSITTTAPTTTSASSPNSLTNAHLLVILYSIMFLR